jgi:hypothetical protein
MCTIGISTVPPSASAAKATSASRQFGNWNATTSPGSTPEAWRSATSWRASRSMSA